MSFWLQLLVVLVVLALTAVAVRSGTRSHMTDSDFRPTTRETLPFADLDWDSIDSADGDDLDDAAHDHALAGYVRRGARIYDTDLAHTIAVYDLHDFFQSELARYRSDHADI